MLNPVAFLLILFIKNSDAVTWSMAATRAEKNTLVKLPGPKGIKHLNML